MHAQRSLGLQVSGRSAPVPIKSFVHAGFEAKLLTAIAKEGFEVCGCVCVRVHACVHAE